MKRHGPTKRGSAFGLLTIFAVVAGVALVLFMVLRSPPGHLLPPKNSARRPEEDLKQFEKKIHDIRDDFEKEFHKFDHEVVHHASGGNDHHQHQEVGNAAEKHDDEHQHEEKKEEAAPATRSPDDVEPKGASPADWLAWKARDTSFTKLPSGMLFKYLKKGTGEKSPTVRETCQVHYKGTLITGKKFDSSYDRGAPASFSPSGVIRGWTEALQLMREGDKWLVVIPPGLAYGVRGHPPVIPGDSVLLFEIELIKVKRTGASGGRLAAAAIGELEEKTGKKYDQL